MMNNNLINEFIKDANIIEIVLSDNLIKNADSGLAAGLANKVKDYVSGKIDDNDKLGSVVNILTPGILTALGHPVLAFLVSLAQNFLGLNVASIIKSAAQKVISWISSGKQVSSDQVSEMVQSSVKENYGSEPTEEDLKKFKLATIHDARLVKLAIMEIQNDIDINCILIHKRADMLESVLKLSRIRANTANILGKIISFTFKTVLASAGFLVGGDLIKGLVNKVTNENNTDNYPSKNTSEPSITLKTPKQNTLKVNPSYVEENISVNSNWIEPTPLSQIDEQIINWAGFIYPDLKNHENLIRNSVGFNLATKKINEYNSNNTSSITFIPKIFSSRKKVVDLFIDEVADKLKQTTPSLPLDAKKPALDI